MRQSRCVVSFTDASQIQHEVEVWASTVYGAIAQAFREFRYGALERDLPGPRTELSVAVHRQPITHRVKLEKVSRWAAGGGTNPHDKLERDHIRRLLEPSPSAKP